MRAIPSDRGQSLVETALVLPVFLLMLLGLIDMGRAVYAYNTVSNAARAGSRVATVNQILTSGGECDQSKPITDPLTPHWSIQACAANGATGLGLDESAVTVSYAPPPTQPTLSCPANPTSVDPLHVGCLVDVTVRYTWSPITPIVSRIWSGIQMNYTSESTIERVFP